MNEPVDKYHYCLNTITVMYRQNIYPKVNPGQNLIELPVLLACTRGRY